jgi:hypothetical protein
LLLEEVLTVQGKGKGKGKGTGKGKGKGKDIPARAWRDSE